MAVKNPTVFLKPMVFGVPNFGQTHFLTLNGCSLGKNIGMRNRTFKACNKIEKRKRKIVFLGSVEFICSYQIDVGPTIFEVFSLLFDPKGLHSPAQQQLFQQSLCILLVRESWIHHDSSICGRLYCYEQRKKIRQCRNGKDKQGYNKPVAADTFLNLRMDFRSP